MSSITAQTVAPYLTWAADNSGNLALATGGASPSTALYINNAQQVGIGTTTPLSALTVISSAGGANGLVLGADTSVSSLSNRLFFVNSTSGQGYVITNNGGSLAFQYGAVPGSSSGTEAMRITSNGSVGIGTSSPASTLHVVGEATITQGVTGFPAFSAYQGTGQSITNGSFQVLQINSVDFDTNSRYNGTGSTVNGIPAWSFMPNVAGYYQVNGQAYLANGSQTELALQLYKNNSGYRYLGDSIVPTSRMVNGSIILYLNGSTDYITLYLYSSVSGTTSTGVTAWSACLVRGA